MFYTQCSFYTHTYVLWVCIFHHHRKYIDMRIQYTDTSYMEDLITDNVVEKNWNYNKQHKCQKMLSKKMLSLSPQNLLCPCLWILMWLNTTFTHPAIQTISHDVLLDGMHLQINQVDNFINLLEIKANKSHWVIIHLSFTWCVSIEEDVRVNTVEWNTSGLKHNQTCIPDILSTRIRCTAVAFVVAWTSII